MGWVVTLQNRASVVVVVAQDQSLASFLEATGYWKKIGKSPALSLRVCCMSSLCSLPRLAFLIEIGASALEALPTRE